MSARGPRPSVAAVAVLAPVLPAGLLAAQLAWLVTRLTDAALAVAVLGAAGAGCAGWGAWSGVRRAPARGFVGRTAVRAGVGAILVAVALAVRLVAVVSPPWDARGLGGVPLVDAATLGTLVALLPFVAAGRAVGRAYRRQADPKATTQQRRDADRAVPAALLSGVVVVAFVSTVGTAAGVGGPLIAGPAPLVWFAVAVLVAVAARGMVLDARAGPAAAPGPASWARRTGPWALGVVAVAVVGVLAVDAAGHVWSSEWLPTLPSGMSGVLDRPPPERAPVGTPDPTPPPDPSTPVVAWVLLMAAALVLLLIVLPRGRRGLRVWRTGARTSLLELLRELFASGTVERRAGDSDEIAIAGPTAARAGLLPAPLASWVRRLRPRPRDPEAAIMYDYRRVQERLPPDRRRRQPETVLTHARRVDAAALDELADLVCAIRYAGRRATPADAERSRELARTLTRH